MTDQPLADEIESSPDSIEPFGSLMNFGLQGLIGQMVARRLMNLLASKKILTEEETAQIWEDGVTAAGEQAQLTLEGNKVRLTTDELILKAREREAAHK